MMVNIELFGEHLDVQQDRQVLL